MEDYPSGRRSTSPALLEDRPGQIGQFGVSVWSVTTLELLHGLLQASALCSRGRFGVARLEPCGELGQLTSLRLSELSEYPRSLAPCGPRYPRGNRAQALYGASLLGRNRGRSAGEYAANARKMRPT